MQDYVEPVWGFSYTDEFGNETYKTFSTTSSTWVEALSRFLDFTRGVGYGVANDAVAINAEIEVGEESWSGNYYTPEDNSFEIDWGRTNDFYPPFEGVPEKLTKEEYEASLIRLLILK